jgi:hypothetical protein
MELPSSSALGLRLHVCGREHARSQIDDRLRHFSPDEPRPGKAQDLWIAGDLRGLSILPYNALRSIDDDYANRQTVESGRNQFAS